MKLLQICKCLHLFWFRRHEPFTAYCWQIFFLKLIRTPFSSPLWSFTKTNSVRLFRHFLDSGADFLLPSGAGHLKRTDNSTKPPLRRIKLWTFWNKKSSWSSAILLSRDVFMEITSKLELKAGFHLQKSRSRNQKRRAYDLVKITLSEVEAEAEELNQSQSVRMETCIVIGLSFRFRFRLLQSGFTRS